MRIKLSGLLPAAAAMSAAATGAMAADLGPYGGRQTWRAPGAYSYQPPMRWAGTYFGIQAGYGWGDTNAATTNLAPLWTEAFSYGTSGGIGGLHAGFNWQHQNFVAGIETDLEMSGIKGSGTGYYGSGHHTSIDWLGSLRARAGFTTGQTLFYLTGGLAYGGVSIEQSYSPWSSPFASNSDWKLGWTAGVGIEHAFTHNISARLEYRYTDLGTFTATNVPANLSDPSEVTQSAVRAGLSFKF